MEKNNLIPEDSYGISDFVNNSRNYGLKSALKEDWYMTKERALNLLSDFTFEGSAVNMLLSPTFFIIHRIARAPTVVYEIMKDIIKSRKKNKGGLERITAQQNET